MTDMNISELEGLLDGKLYTAQEVSDLFQITKATVIKWILAGPGYKYLKVGNRYRIPKATVLQIARDKIKIGGPKKDDKRPH